MSNNALTNDLGAALGLDFDIWTHSQTATTSAVSNRIGEVLNWDGAAAGNTVTVGAANYVLAGASTAATPPTWWSRSTPLGLATTLGWTPATPRSTSPPPAPPPTL